MMWLKMCRLSISYWFRSTNKQTNESSRDHQAWEKKGRKIDKQRKRKRENLQQLIHSSKTIGEIGWSLGERGKTWEWGWPAHTHTQRFIEISQEDSASSCDRNCKLSVNSKQMKKKVQSWWEGMVQGVTDMREPLLILSKTVDPLCCWKYEAWEGLLTRTCSRSHRSKTHFYSLIL